jgi:hypothetical protein
MACRTLPVAGSALNNRRTYPDAGYNAFMSSMKHVDIGAALRRSGDRGIEGAVRQQRPEEP